MTGIELVIDFRAYSHVMTSHYVKDHADRFHPSFNKDERNVYTILDGKLTMTGLAAPVMSRCLKTGKE